MSTPIRLNRQQPGWSWQSGCLLVLCICLMFHTGIAWGLFQAGENLKDDDPSVPWHIAADELSYDSQAEVYVAKGNVTITKLNKRLSADFVRFDHKKMIAHASGNVVMVAGEDLLSGNAIDVDLVSETGVLYEGTIFLKENHFYISGEKIQKTGDQTYKAEKAALTSCDGSKPDWKITGRNVNVTIEGYGTLSHATLQAKDVPVLYAPYFVFPAKTKRQSGLLVPEFAYSSRNGFEYTQPLYWAISDNSDATLYGMHITQRGEKVGLEYRYVLDPESKGMAIFDYLSDSKVDDGTGTSSQDWGYPGDAYLRPNSDRYWFRMKHDQALPDRIHAKLDLDIVSDQDYLQDFRHGYLGFDQSNLEFYSVFGRNIDDYNDPVRVNRLNLSKYWTGYSLNAEARYYDNVNYRRWSDTDPTLQKLPVIDFYGSKKEVPSTPLYFEATSQYVNYYRKDGTRGHRADLYPRVSYPYRFRNYFTFEPSVGVRETAWYVDEFKEHPQDSNSAMSRNIYDLNLDLSTELFKIFPFEAGSTEKLKHIIRPQLVYSYIPNRDQDGYPNFDSTDRIQGENLLTYSLTNTLISKARPKTELPAESQRREFLPSDYLYNEFMRFYVEQSYDIYKANHNDPEPFTPIYGELQYEPFRYLTLQADAQYSHYQSNFKTRNIGSLVSDTRGDKLFVEYRYERDFAESIYTNLLFSISKNLHAYTDYEQNLYDAQRISSGFGVKYIAQCWSIDVRFIDEMDDRRYVLLLNLFGIGGFGSSTPSREFEDIFGGRNSMMSSPYQVVSMQ
ncbi:LPS-assembly protein LptD [Desulfatirhabdium butyrativorans]|uniref:LPS-assembly protein LptD n=1 Tax=Desulfatirhabdium butyrativorans TaxID=340467 RepID=UPI00146FADE0|nr:LPS assembly protein LptD [Desulfatirhabdium butyrativorans]